MTHLNERKILFLANFLLAMSEGNLVEAYEILVSHVVSGYLSFGISYGARRGAKKLGEYLNQKRYFILKIICGVFIVLVTIILIKGRSKIRKFFKKMDPKNLYVSFKTRRREKVLKDKEKLESLYAM